MLSLQVYRSASLHLSHTANGVKVKSYVNKSCYTKASCDSGNDLFRQCKKISSATCELDCCDKDGCNGDTETPTKGSTGGTNSSTLAAVSVILMVACAFMALFR